MSTQQFKNFFLFSLSVSMLFACGVGGFYVWKHEQEKVLLEEIRQEEIAKQKAKRAQLDEYYEIFITTISDKLNCYRLRCENEKGYSDIAHESYLLNRDAEIEQQMLHDGYDRAEIQEIWGNANQRADKRMQERIERSEQEGKQWNLKNT